MTLIGSSAERVESQEQGARRIVTTLPSATEIVALLGLEENLVGITHECDYPPRVRRKAVVMRSVFDTTAMSNREIDDSVLSHVTKGESLYQIDEQLLRSLKPDLVITQELCDVCATPLRDVSRAVASLETKPDILSLAPRSLEDVLEDVIRVGRATGTIEKAKGIVAGLQDRINAVRQECKNARDRPSVFCLEWMDPIYCSGHWMPELVDYAGGRELLGKPGEPSTVISWEDVRKSEPDTIFLTVCGYSVQKTLGEIKTLAGRNGWSDLRAVKTGNVYVLDGNSYYSRSGPRLVDGLEILAHLLHPEIFQEYKTPENSAYSLSERKYV